MPVIIPWSDAEQGSPEWHELRRGIPTSSNFKRILTQDGKKSKSWPGYVDELALESVTGVQPAYNNYATQLGHEQEPQAVWLYSTMNDVVVQNVAFVYKDEKRRVGASTDGLIDTNGIFECKGGYGTTHIQRLRKHVSNPNLFASQHFQQVQGELYVCERDWVDLFGFFPGLRPLEVRVYRDEKWIKRLNDVLPEFLYDLEETITFLKQS